MSPPTSIHSAGTSYCTLIQIELHASVSLSLFLSLPLPLYLHMFYSYINTQIAKDVSRSGGTCLSICKPVSYIYIYI